MLYLSRNLLRSSCCSAKATDPRISKVTSVHGTFIAHLSVTSAQRPAATGPTCKFCQLL